MLKGNLVESLRVKYLALVNDLDERGRRRWAATEAMALGYGGITAVAAATGLSDRTVKNGIKELRHPEPLTATRQRREGGGRKKLEYYDQNLRQAIERLIEPSERGDPQSPLRRTCKSLTNLQAQMKQQGHPLSRTKLAETLKELGYSLQGNRKTREGKDHPDRDLQFEHIARRVKAYRHGGRPAISVDTKKKEVLGTKANAGREYRPKGEPLAVDTHDFPDKKLGKAVPYGVYDIAKNEAIVSIGISHDTAEFAVESIRRWWYELGQLRYAKPHRLLITADSGGSNGHRSRLWKLELQRLADEIGIKIEVCHYPPGTSKWNKIEHRLFCHITRNWRGVPLETHQVVVNLVSSTRTHQGLEVHCWLDGNLYQKGRKVTDKELGSVRLKRNSFQGDWNYEIQPHEQLKVR
ncbi:ISAzo13 family transposase [cf. Phormidesmis sp. LEGE 11477]|uniref:ISAzo13 family transposase n=1 Tax=cf. Phormidesmis sp. LEGE 11477 TaxID=1828680 RepID=UPI00187F7A10|nr:ISAzo13 family transposase [cf. Phormidesmis sp. LEGE 11477]MBE9060941.1 ISAzo13 family transposase [cf. Phormidesmis sp. LEGE 11477]